jgi:sugar phosphate isomerase/epimerase
MKIGTFADWFGVGLIDGIRMSRKCGADGVQVYAWKEFNPQTARKSLISEVRKTSTEEGQEIAALCGELGGHGFEIASDNERKTEYLKSVVDMGEYLGCRVVTTHIGVIPPDPGSEKYRAMLAACSEVGRHAAGKGAKIAIETGPEPVERLRAFVDACGTPGVGINYDPANLVMVTNVDEVEGVRAAGGAIAHTHAKDGVMRKFYGVEAAYAIFAEGGIEEMQKLSEYYEERPLGQGSVRWPEYIAALRETGYDGYLTIEREAREKSDEIADAVKFLRKLL